MAPERRDEIGIVHYSNPLLGVEECEYPSNFHFFGGDSFVEVFVNGREGYQIGTVEPIEFSKWDDPMQRLVYFPGSGVVAIAEE